MKNRGIIIVLLFIISAIILFWVWPWESHYELGKLEPSTDTTITSFCEYEITRSKCELVPFYKNGDIICIECCVNRNKPWPPNVRGVNNCPKEISFISQDGTCEYFAKRQIESCAACPANNKAKFKCPNL